MGYVLRLETLAQSQNRGGQVTSKFSKYVGMDTHKDTIAVAIAQASGGKPRYYGEIANTPQAGAKLVDVRSKPELLYVGRVPGSLLVEWQSYPGNQLNAEFLDQLAQVAGPQDTLMFICRSGARSHSTAAAATQAGWRECYNVLEGFEGDKDAAQHRNTLGGWRKAGLPWVQG